MGTFVRIRAENIPDVSRAVKKSVERMNDIVLTFNRFSQDSEISRVNKDAYARDINVSDDFAEVLDLSFRMTKKTGGAFDVTSAPLVELWGLYSGKLDSMPDEHSIADALESVGPDKVSFDRRAKTIRFKNEGVSLDMNAIAKGFAVDEAATALKESGISNAIIDAGGDIYLAGDNNGLGWNVGIRDPLDKKRVSARINVKNRAIATSGGYENFVAVSGERLPHIVDPRTGGPVKSGILSATVFAEKCAAADALATAVFVLGPDEGLRVIEGIPGADCVIILKEAGSLKYVVSKDISGELEIL